MVAASAWDALAAELDSFARGYSSVISALQDEAWTGAAAQAMAAAAAPYAEWAATTAGQAEQAASQARAAAAAYETAHAAVVPPPKVAANRTLLAYLIQTNILGHNTPQIGATEAAYDAMWVQDASAMHGYAASASSATKLTLFAAPPQTTNQAAAPAASATATGSQSSLSQFLSQFIQTVSQFLSGSNPGPPNFANGIPIPQSLLTDYSAMGSIFNGFDNFGAVWIRNVATVAEYIVVMTKLFTDGVLYSPATGLAGATAPAVGAAVSPTVLAAADAGAGANRAVLASVGEARAVGQLSAPSNWANATPAAAATDRYLSSWGTQGSWDAAPKMQVAGTGPAAMMGPMSGAAGAAAARKITRPSVSAVLQVTPPRYEMPRPSSGG
ncbi:PPE family protein [Mycobacterium sp. SVM_VP21]|nr:PPE family protein [Mycobacterium sp. SVM_VP21]